MPTEEELAAQQQDEMNDALQTPEPIEAEPPVVEAAAPEPPVEAPPVETPPTPAGPEPPVPPVKTEAERLSEDNARLREELNELARRTGTFATPPAQPTVAPQGPPLQIIPQQQAPVEPGRPLEFVTEEEAETLLDKPKEVLNTILNKVFQAGREQAMREMPTLVRQQTMEEVSIQAKVQKFWADNADLQHYRDFCTMVANQVEIENPGMTFDEVLNKTAERTRERLKLTKPEPGTPPQEPQKEVPVQEPSAKPALPTGPRSARRPAPVPIPTDAQQKEIDDIMSVL